MYTSVLFWNSIETICTHPSSEFTPRENPIILSTYLVWRGSRFVSIILHCYGTLLLYWVSSSLCQWPDRCQQKPFILFSWHFLWCIIVDGMRAWCSIARNSRRDLRRGNSHFCQYSYSNNQRKKVWEKNHGNQNFDFQI